MKNFQSVLAFGDSHVAGCELSDQITLEDYISGKVSLEEADDAGKEFAFPNLVATQLKLPCYNYAMTGGSNARSLRKLIQAVQKHPNSLVLFGYTCTDRTEFYYPRPGNFLGRDSDNFIQVGMQWNGAIKKAGMEHPINDMYVDEILHPYNNLNDVMFCVDNICTMYATRYFHIPLFPEGFIADGSVIDFEGHTNYLEWCRDKQFTRLPFLHYGKDAHSALAKLILGQL
jgi:hypothetical protein